MSKNTFNVGKTQVLLCLKIDTRYVMLFLSWTSLMGFGILCYLIGSLNFLDLFLKIIILGYLLFVDYVILLHIEEYLMIVNMEEVRKARQRGVGP